MWRFDKSHDLRFSKVREAPAITEEEDRLLRTEKGKISCTLQAAARRQSLITCQVAKRGNLAGTDYLCTLRASAQRLALTSCRVVGRGELAVAEFSPPHPRFPESLPFPFFSFHPPHPVPSFPSLPLSPVLSHPASLLLLHPAGRRPAAGSGQARGGLVAGVNYPLPPSPH